MRAIPPSVIADGHPDYPVLLALSEIVISKAGGLYRLKQEVPTRFRQALNEVIDTPRTGRITLDELEKTEKTYIGTKIEILLRDLLDLPKGKLDLLINGKDVDIKNTIGSNWMIPSEAIAHPCILAACDETKSQCFLGVFVAHRSNLGNSTNRDGKRSLSTVGFQNILWILNGDDYPRNLLAQLDRTAVDYITDMKNIGGSERLYRLFSTVLQTPVSRETVQGVARQKDYMKRLRTNGGARDKLRDAGIALLSGNYDSAVIAQLGLPHCRSDEFISIRIETEKQKRIINL
jgi:hypothetical protein